MRSLFVLVALLLSSNSTLAADADKPEPKKKDQQLIQGNWIVTSFIAGGNKVPKEATAGMRIVITNKSITFKKNNQDGIQIQYTIDPTKSPKTIDTTHEIDRGKPIAQLGIYVLEGDSLSLCIEAAGKDRPASFKTKTGSVFVLRRAP